jgi:histidine triad (HIT) family protein
MSQRRGERVDGCIFCMIAAGEIPASVVYEDDAVVAFRDLHPQAPAHVLVVPRVHYSGLDDDVPAEVLAAVLGAAPHVAEATGIAESGYRVIMNTGPDAGQTVPHLHMHVLGGVPMSEGMVRPA